MNSALYVAFEAGHAHAPARNHFEYSDAESRSARRSASITPTWSCRNLGYFKRQPGHSASHVASGLRRSVKPVAPTPPAGSSTSTTTRSSACRHQEDQRRRHPAGPFNWAGVVDQYFAAVFLPDDSRTQPLVTLRHQVDVPKDPQNPIPETRSKSKSSARRRQSAWTQRRASVRWPKSLGVLESVPVPTMTGAPPDLRGLVDFGFFGVIARPLFLWLKWTYEQRSTTGDGRSSSRP